MTCLTSIHVIKTLQHSISSTGRLNASLTSPGAAAVRSVCGGVWEHVLFAAGRRRGTTRKFMIVSNLLQM